MIPRLEAKLKTDPNDKQSMTELAQGYYQANRPDLTLALTQKLIAAGSKTAQVYYLDGVANLSLGRLKEGLASLENASNIEPTNITVLGTLTTAYLRSNRPADAERVAKRAITFNKDDKDAYIAYGQVLATEQKYADARTQFQEAEKLDPKDAHPVVLEARTYSDENAIALAAQVYDRAVQVDPRSFEALVGKARVEAAQHDVKDAVATFQQLYALQTDDEDKAAVLDEIAHEYAVEKMDSEADNMYRSAIAQFPKVPATHLSYGDYLAFKNDMAGAEREWTAAAGPNRDNPDALGRLGDLYAKKNDHAKAIDNYKRLTDIANQDGRAFLLLANAYVDNKQYDKARDAFRHSFALQQTPDALVGLAQADYVTKDYKECALIYGNIDKSSPQFTKQNPTVLYVLGQCREKSGDAKGALEVYKRFLPYTRPGSQANKEVKALVAKLDKPAPKPTKAPQKK